jgi:hypothetical protein
LSLLDFLRPQQAQAPGAMQQPSGLSRILQPEVALPMAAMLLGNQGNAANFGNALGAAGQGLQAQKAEQKKQAELNKTLEFFKKSAPEYAEMVASGMPIGDAWKTYTEQKYAQTKAPASVQEYEYAKNSGAFGGNYTDWQTKGIREQDKGFKQEQDLRKEYGATPEYKRYDDVRAAYERVRSSASMDSGAGDIGTIFGFMKMLDPGSVVREGEFATAQNSSGIPDRVRNMYNSAINGERLTPEQRAEFVRTSDALYTNEAKRIEGLNTRYTDIAGQHQIDPNSIVQQPAQFEPLQIGATKDLGNGITITRTGN